MSNNIAAELKEIEKVLLQLCVVNVVRNHKPARPALSVVANSV
jgi:hypothetical protein